MQNPTYPFDCLLQSTIKTIFTILAAHDGRTIRVTRFAEFSPIGRLFSLGILKKYLQK
jgi:hypothetical protein